MLRLAFLLPLLATLILAQTEKRVIPIDPAQVQSFDRQRNVGVAILVGVAKYPRYSGLSELRYTGRDVDLLEQELTRQRYTVLALKDGEATKGAVLNAIRQAGEAVDQKNGTIVFFFSGHGYADGSANYLATFDAASNSLAQSGLSLSAVEKALAESGAPRRVMWIDACRNEPGKGAGDARSFARFAGSAGTRILFSTKAGRISYEDDELQQGLFSYYLARGLKGEAAREDGLVSFRDLSDFVTDGVQSRSLKQGRLQVPYEAGESSGDFLLARGTVRFPAAAAERAPSATARPNTASQKELETELGRLAQKANALNESLTAEERSTRAAGGLPEDLRKAWNAMNISVNRAAEALRSGNVSEYLAASELARNSIRKIEVDLIK